MTTAMYIHPNHSGHVVHLDPLNLQQDRLGLLFHLSGLHQTPLYQEITIMAFFGFVLVFYGCVPNFHEFSGLKKHSVLSLSWLEIQTWHDYFLCSEFHKTKIKTLFGLCSPLRLGVVSFKLTCYWQNPYSNGYATEISVLAVSWRQLSVPGGLSGFCCMSYVGPNAMAIYSFKTSKIWFLSNLVFRKDLVL